MKNDMRKFRRILRLQRRVKYAGPGESRPPTFSLSVPRDFVERMRLEPGDRFRVHEIGGVLAYEKVEAAE